jgi:hypothetical protein
MSRIDCIAAACPDGYCRPVSAAQERKQNLSMVGASTALLPFAGNDHFSILEDPAT